MLTANMKMIAECADKLAHLGEKLFNETEMKYRAGNKVRIKSLDWYNENKGMNGLVGLFTPSMKKLCGMVVTLDSAYNGKYTAIETEAKGYYLDDSMIEGLVEEEETYDFLKTDTPYPSKPKLEDFLDMFNDTITLPEGFIFKDENGNVINATKIVLEKKKLKYPRTINECRDILEDATGDEVGWYAIDGWQFDLLEKMQKLLICRDAYWKIAGEEMGLGKPWDMKCGCGEWGYWIGYDVNENKIYCQDSRTLLNRLLVFPTKEMRDAFYENFKELIGECKELL